MDRMIRVGKEDLITRFLLDRDNNNNMKPFWDGRDADMLRGVEDHRVRRSNSPSRDLLTPSRIREFTETPALPPPHATPGPVTEYLAAAALLEESFKGEDLTPETHEKLCELTDKAMKSRSVCAEEMRMKAERAHRSLNGEEDPVIRHALEGLSEDAKHFSKRSQDNPED